MSFTKYSGNEFMGNLCFSKYSGNESMGKLCLTKYSGNESMGKLCDSRNAEAGASSPTLCKVVKL